MVRLHVFTPEKRSVDTTDGLPTSSGVSFDNYSNIGLSSITIRSIKCHMYYETMIRSNLNGWAEIGTLDHLPFIMTIHFPQITSLQSNFKTVNISDQGIYGKNPFDDTPFKNKTFTTLMTATTTYGARDQLDRHICYFSYNLNPNFHLGNVYIPPSFQIEVNMYDFNLNPLLSIPVVELELDIEPSY